MKLVQKTEEVPLIVGVNMKAKRCLEKGMEVEITKNYKRHARTMNGYFEKERVITRSKTAKEKRRKVEVEESEEEEGSEEKSEERGEREEEEGERSEERGGEEEEERKRKAKKEVR